MNVELMAEIVDAEKRIREDNERIARETGMPRTACIRTFGCQMNEHDSEKIQGMLRKMGFDILPDCALNGAAPVPDLIVFNTCCVRENAEDKIFGQIGAVKGAKKVHPGLIVAVCGCMTEQKWAVERIRNSYKHVDLVLGTGNSYRLPQYLAERIFEGKKQIGAEPEDSVPEGVPAERRDRAKAFVTVMYGCDNFCSYCIVPYVRGRERSRRPDDVVNEIRALAAAGTKEVMLLGQNVNSYGKKFETQSSGSDCTGPEGEPVSFARLIKRIASETDIQRIRFMTSHPKDISDELIEVIATEPKVCRQLHLPVQSGSTSELRRMNRKYTREQYLGTIARVRRAVPDIALSTDVMIGFPGETEEEFEDTLSLLEQVRFDAAFTFIYSRRSGTPAAEWPGQITEETAKERFGRLVETQNRISHEKNEALLGTVSTVLTEGTSRTDPGRFTGRGEDNRIVKFTVPGGMSVGEGDVAEVLITGIQTWSLEGRMLRKNGTGGEREQ